MTMPRLLIGTPGVSPRTLAAVELRRQLRRPVIWIGFVLTIVMLIGSTTDWSGGSYNDKILGFMPLVLATLICGYLTSSRDQRQLLVEDAPLDPNDRTLARLLSVFVPVVMSVVIVVGIAVASRIEGGFWIGDEPRRTDNALHSVLELLQPPLVVALAGMFGVGAGRASRGRAISIMALGTLIWFLSFPGYWVMNAPPVHAFALVQIQPLTIDLELGIEPEQLPENWLADAPSEFSDVWERRIVHQPTIAGHNLYLLGLIAVVAGVSIRTRTGRRLALTGALLAIGGIAIQLALMPPGLT